jgi:hypothetical protein
LKEDSEPRARITVINDMRFADTATNTVLFTFCKMCLDYCQLMLSIWIKDQQKLILI